MKKLALYICLILIPVLTKAQGYPPIRNYQAKEYGAHNYNFDIVIGEDGTVFVANFEGLLYYDRAQWRILHTQGINRLTVVYKAKDNVIWLGGYNYFARLRKGENGELFMERVGRPDLFRGEVLEIYEDENSLQFLVSDGNIYEIKDGQAIFKKSTGSTFSLSLQSNIIHLDDLKQGNSLMLSDIQQTEKLDDGLVVKVKNEHGLVVSDNTGRELYTITEANGLCSDNVHYVAYDKHGLLWGATDHGVFSIELPSIYSVFLPKEGLKGVVHAIAELDGTMYVGTSNKLFRIKDRLLEAVANVTHCCWKLCVCSQGLLAATSNGIYLLSSDGKTQQLTTGSTMEIFVDGQQIYSGETDGVYLFQIGQQPRKICDLEKVTKIQKDAQGTIWLQNIYGRVYRKLIGEDDFHPYKSGTSENIAATIVQVDGQVKVVNAIATTPFPYPTFSMTDNEGGTWLTDNESKHLYLWKNGERQSDLDKLLFPVSEMMVSALFRQGNKLWIGGDEILTVIDMDKSHLLRLTEKPRLLFRSVIIGRDSVLWGGYGEMPNVLPQLSSDEKNIKFIYGLDHTPISGHTFYRYKLNDNKWSVWTEEHDEAQFYNLAYGTYTLSVQAQLSNGQLSEIATVMFNIAYPFYMRWYMIFIYLVALALMIYGVFRLRLEKLNQDNLKLEKIVKERTSEVVKQKDEIEEKSRSLEKALDELGNAQHELIRQEKMATVGKLTQGLIDRILNPLNYINNFSKLSQDLVKDIKANVEDDKENMKQDNYEDTIDVLNMLTGNLQKVSEHGQNTTRTLKAMEEMLKDRTGGYVDMDLASVLKQDEKMLNTYYTKEKEEYHIKFTFSIPEGPMMLHGNPELLSKTTMSLLGNSIYAVVKKALREKQFEPEVSVSMTETNGHYVLRIYDNGIGIENTIIDKIFDPFFTTKTTGEASGIGLYLSHEIIQNHGGDIAVKSEKNKYCEFIITLPTLKK